MVAVDNGAKALEDEAGAYHASVLRYERAEAQYNKALHTQVIKIVHKYKQAGDKLPAEDVRRALAHESIDPEVYAEYLEAKAQKEATAVRYRALEKALSARQSLLRAL